MDSVHFTVDTYVEPVDEFITFEWPSVVMGGSYMTVNVTTDDDVDSCLLSLDLGSNVSMNRINDRSWYYSFITLEEGLHEVRAWCDHSGVWETANDSFRILTTGFIINIEEPLNRTYWETDSIDIFVTINIGAEICVLNVTDGPDDVGLHNLTRQNDMTWFYDISDADAGQYTITVGCNDTIGLYNESTVSFAIYHEQCIDNRTGMCSDAQQCLNSTCVDLTCTGCSYAEDHECKPHECCFDDDCLESQECLSNDCVAVDCECGIITNHTCLEYDCCSNFDCESDEECDTETHECRKKKIVFIMPEVINAGEEVSITVVDDERIAIEGVRITIEYKSGVEETYTTDENGTITFVAKEAGEITLIAYAEGYDMEIVTLEVIPGIDITAVILLIVIAAGAGTGFLFWKQRGPVSLSKEVMGKSVILRVKNRGSEQLESVMILDRVPKGAFISCNLMPQMEDVGDETHLTWIAMLTGGEEISINYETTGATEGFFVKIGDDEYHSGSGLSSIFGSFSKKPPERSQEEYD
jgi:hypothetical protein